MAKTPLRAYNSDIDKLIDNKQSPEAIAHCKYILKHFPKHIDTYRLLGKAYLEMQRYSEASDILQRVLSVIPDDFISQIGMSVIREDEGNLDASLYHMERAFEVQPANPAIQDELRRVYGRRDGVEPARIRLTRGALVRLYTRGELFLQAIAEANAALAEDPQRVDLEVALARLYFLSGQKVQAAEVSSKLVSRLPYCLEANRILADVLPGSSRPEDAKIYQERIVALDPYAAMIGDHAQNSTEVPDNAVQIERLNYQPGQDEGEQPDWARTVGVAWDAQPAASATPDWLSGEEQAQDTFTEVEMPVDTSLPELPATEATEIPDWMAAAGWAPSDGAEIPPSPFAESEIVEFEEAGEGLAAPAEIPDWLQAMSPESSAQSESDTGIEDSAWLDGLLGKPESIASGEGSTLETVEPVSSDELPDWLVESSPLNEAEPTSPAEDPEWMQIAAVSSDQIEMPGAQAEEAASASQIEIPEWLQVSDETSDQIDVLDAQTVESDPSLAFSEPEIPVSSDADQTTVLVDLQSETPDLHVDAQSTQEITEVIGDKTQPQPEDDIDAAMAWLESLAAKQGADEATLGTPLEERTTELPDWLKQETPTEPVSLEEQMIEPASSEFSEIEPVLSNAPENDEDAAQLLTEDEIVNLPEIADELIGKMIVETSIDQSTIKAEELTDAIAQISENEYESILPEDVLAAKEDDTSVILEPVGSGEEEDDAFAWLESLAARQGADEGTLLVEAEERPETTPEWIAEATKSSADAVHDEATTVEAVTPQQPGDLLPSIDAIESQSQGEPDSPAEAESPLPDWLQDIDEYTRAERESKPDDQPEETLPEWLHNLESIVEDEEAITASPAIAASISDWKPEDSAAEPDVTETEADLEAALKELEAQSVLENEPSPEPEPVMRPEPQQPSIESIPQTLQAQPASDLLSNAQQALSKGDVDSALQYFNQLISENSHLEETIHDLRDASYRYPVNSDIWQALGDAYSRSNHIQEALDAYTKAEELFR